MAAAFWVILHEYQKNQNNQNNLRVTRKILRDMQNPFDIPEKMFQHLYRLSREAVRQLCLDLLPYLPQRIKATGIPPELKNICDLDFTAVSRTVQKNNNMLRKEFTKLSASQKNRRLQSESEDDDAENNEDMNVMNIPVLGEPNTLKEEIIKWIWIPNEFARRIRSLEELERCT